MPLVLQTFLTSWWTLFTDSSPAGFHGFKTCIIFTFYGFGQDFGEQEDQGLTYVSKLNH